MLDRSQSHLPATIAPNWVAIVARLATSLPVLIAFGCLIGWVYQIDVLICVGAGLAAMKVNTAIGLALAGIGQLFWLRTQSPRQGWISPRAAGRTAMLLGCCLSALATLTLLQDVLHLDFGIDNLVFADHDTMTGELPGRMSPATAVTLLAFGLTLITEQMLFTWIALSIAGFALICYLLDLHALAKLSLLDMALHASIAFVLLGLGRIMGRAHRGMMHLLMVGGLGGTMARTMLPVAVLAPITVSWLAGFTQRRGLLDGNVSAAFGAILGIILLVTMVFVTGRAMTAADLRRRRAELELRLSHDALETKVRKRTEELRQARDEANNANRHKSVFLAHMSHELRTPLNAILGFADIMRREQFGSIGQPRYATYADDIHNSGSHLLALINDILDLSKIEAGKYEFSPQELDAAALVHACHDLMSGLARERHLRFLVEADSHLPPLIADERAIKQILINLLSNAIKFTPSNGAITLTVTASAPHAAAAGLAPRLVFTVTDTGIGMSETEIAKAQTPFGQIQNQFSRTHQGTGLGLFLAKELTERQAGTLTIDSHPGQGTTIRVNLPVIPAASLANPAEARATA